MTMPARLLSIVVLASAISLNMAHAQSTTTSFGALTQDTSLPVEVEADTLTVNNTDGTAVFEGNVLVSQGEMRLSAPKVDVQYGTTTSEIETLNATGGVTITNLGDAAQAKEALYTIDSGKIVLTGDVLLTQNNNILSGKKMTIDLKTGVGVMEGRAATTFQPKAKK